MIMYTWFQIIDDLGNAVIYECQKCGEVFTIEDGRDDNSEYYDYDSLSYLPICPHCGLKGEY